MSTYGAHNSPSTNSELLAALTPGASPCCVLACNTVASSTVTSTVVPHCNTVTSSSDFSGWYISTVLSSPLLLMQHSRPTLAFKSFISPLPVLFLLRLLPHHQLLLMAFFQCLLLPLSPDSSGFFNGMQTVFKPGALNCFTFIRLILLTLSVSRNPILTNLPLSGFMDSLLCVLIAPTPSPAFSLLMTDTLAAAS